MSFKYCLFFIHWLRLILSWSSRGLHALIRWTWLLLFDWPLPLSCWRAIVGVFDLSTILFVYFALWTVYKCFSWDKCIISWCYYYQTNVTVILSSTNRLKGGVLHREKCSFRTWCSDGFHYAYMIVAILNESEDNTRCTYE